jgi:hypothetical protein
MPSMPAEGSFPPPQPYQDTINNDDVFGYLGEHYDGNQALNTTFVPSTPLPTYGSRTNVPQIRPTEQQLSTSYSSPPDTLGRSSSGNKRKRVSVDQWQPVDSMLLVGRPLTPAGEQMLSIWHQTHQRMPMEGELVALSVVTGAAERAITYWLSCHRSPPFPVPMTLPIPPSSGSSSNNVPTTPTPTASSRKNTCNVKKRVPKPWNKAWDEEKPYSCLCRCGWTFTKKGDWIKHEKINFPEHTFHCPVPDCRSNFGRKDKCRDHIRKVHKISQTEQFDLDSRRTSVAQDHNDRCGFCGHFCTSWQEWYDHVGAHFENRIEGGPWTMSMWRYPWIHDAEAGHGDEGPDDGNDPDNGSNDDSEKDAEHETDYSFNGYEGGGPSHGSKRGGGDSGGRQSRSGGGRSGFQHMDAKYCTRSSHPPAPSALSEALKAASRTNSMPQLNQQHPRRRTKKNKKQDQLKMNHPITWPLTEEQAVPKVAPGSSLRTERINPLVDLAVAGKSARDAHIAELAPYLEDKAQVVSQPSPQGKPDEAPTQTANLSVMNVSSHMDATSEDFDELNGRKHQGLLDRIDDLRSQGVFDDLPQLVVCGDQSSGKSSVLEAITGIPFPKKDIQSTRFATEVVLKPKGNYSLLLSIDPDVERSLSRRVPRDKAQVSVQRCSSCDKEFKRPCDLRKHKKTHSRPWKFEAGIQFIASANPQLVTLPEQDKLKTHDAWTKSPHWRAHTAANLLSDLEIRSDLVVNQQDNTTEILGIAQKNSPRDSQNWALDLRGSGIDSIVTINSDNVQMVNNWRSTAADEINLKSTCIELDGMSSLGLAVSYRNLMNEESIRNAPSPQQTVAILETMIKDARRLVSRTLSMFRKPCRGSSLSSVVHPPTRWRGVNEPANTSWEKEQLLYSIFGTQDYEQPRLVEGPSFQFEHILTASLADGQLRSAVTPSELI